MLRALRFVPAVAVAILIFFLSSQPPPRLPWQPFAGFDKLAHAGIFGLLTATLLFGARWPSGRALWWCAGIASLYGVTDELHQLFIPGRSPEVYDWIADTAGALLVATAWRVYGARR